MKKFLSIIALFAICATANAQQVQVANVSTLPGEKGVITLSVDPAGKTFVGMSFDFKFVNDGFTIGTAKIVDTDAWNGGSVVMGDIGGVGEGIARGAIVSTSLTAIPDGMNDIVSIEVLADADMELGEYNVILTNVTFNAENTADDYVVDGDIPFTITVSDRWVLDENATSLPATSGNVNVTVKRTIKGGQWSTIVLPFQLNKAKAEAAFGATAQYAQLNSVETTFVDPDEDFTTVAITLDFASYTLGGVRNLKKGVPYLIKTENDIESFDIDAVAIDNTISPATVNDVNFDSDIQAKFMGSFVKTKVPADALFLSGSKLYYSTGKSNLKGFRGYFVADAIVGKVFGEVKMNYVIDGTTRINGLNADKANDAIYDLSGRRIQNPQQRGIYIVNGKKVAK